MACMTTLPEPWHTLRACAAWEYRAFATGPLAHLLMHVVADPAGLLRDDDHGAARASVRLVLRNGTVFGAAVVAPRDSLVDVLLVVGRELAGQPYDEPAFGTLDAALAAALPGGTQISLERNGTALPRPLLSSHQLGRLARHAVQCDCPPALLVHWERAASNDDPAVLAYLATRDAHATAYAQAARKVHGMAPDSLAVYNFIAARSGPPRNRAQAMLALPWLLPLMTGRMLPSLLASIDAGLPLHDAVAITFAVSREVVRWVGRHPLPVHWEVNIWRMRRWLTLLSWLPPERRPRDLAQCAALQAMADALSAPLQFMGRRDEKELLTRMGPCMQHWLAHAPSHADPVWVAALADATDFLRALCEACEYIDGHSPEAANLLVLAWCASVSVTRLLTLSRAWHADMAAQGWSPGSDAGVAHWPPVLDAPWQHDQRAIVELTSREQLRTEGQAMAHCVGGYAEMCRSGNSMIVSLRDGSGAPLSTAELQVHDGAPRVTVTQHRAASNAAPAPACADALRALLAHLERGGLAEALSRRRAFQREQLATRQRDRCFSGHAQAAALFAMMNNQRRAG
jgi:hypothetical protein